MKKMRRRIEGGKIPFWKGSEKHKISQAAETLATHSMNSNKMFFVKTKRMYNIQQEHGNLQDAQSESKCPKRVKMPHASQNAPNELCLKRVVMPQTSYFIPNE